MKKFDSNPVEEFMSTPAAKSAPDMQAYAKRGRKPKNISSDDECILSAREIRKYLKANPAVVEKRTRRTQIVLKPTVYADVICQVRKDGGSFNDFVEAALVEKLDAIRQADEPEVHEPLKGRTKKGK